MKKVLTTTILVFLLTASLLAQGNTGSQGGSSATSSPEAGSGQTTDETRIATAPSADAKPEEVPELSSVSQAALLPHLNKTITVRGIISSYLGQPQTYRFSMDDSSAVLVIGDFPEMGGATWVLTARVVQGGAKQLQLSEVSKVPYGSGGGGGFSGLKGTNAIFLAAGGLLILAAVIAIVAYARNNRKQQEMAYQAQLERERREADERERRLQQAIMEAQKQKTEAVPLKPAAPPRTVVSRGLVTILSGPHSGQTFPLLDHRTSIGREPHCDVILDKDTAVSSKHADIILTPDQRIFFDDQSRNGSMVDGEMISMTKVQKHGPFEATVGGTRIRIEPYVGEGGLSNSPASQTVPASSSGQIVAPSASSAPSGARANPTMFEGVAGASTASPTFVGFAASLELLGGGSAGKAFDIRSEATTLGRENRDILLTDDTVSRKHATIKVSADGFTIFDDGSMHGTFVNDVRVGQDGFKLSNGDLIRLGKTEEVLRFVSIGE